MFPPAIKKQKALRQPGLLPEVAKSWPDREHTVFFQSPASPGGVPTLSRENWPQTITAQGSHHSSAFSSCAAGMHHHSMQTAEVQSRPRSLLFFMHVTT